MNKYLLKLAIKLPRMAIPKITKKLNLPKTKEQRQSIKWINKVTLIHKGKTLAKNKNLMNHWATGKLSPKVKKNFPEIQEMLQHASPYLAHLAGKKK